MFSVQVLHYEPTTNGFHMLCIIIAEIPLGFLPFVLDLERRSHHHLHFPLLDRQKLPTLLLPSSVLRSLPPQCPSRRPTLCSARQSSSAAAAAAISDVPRWMNGFRQQRNVAAAAARAASIMGIRPPECMVCPVALLRLHPVGNAMGGIMVVSNIKIPQQ